MEKYELISTLKELSKFVKADANTFIWAKSKKGFNTNGNMGGGNFSIALTSLVFISLLAKIYKIIHPDAEEDINGLFNDRGIFRDETGAVECFIKAINNEVKIIEEVEDTKDFWGLMRHGLVHCFLPKNKTSTISAIGENVINDFSRYLERLNKCEDYPIKKNQMEGFDCDADLLAVRAKQAAIWLIYSLKKFDGYDGSKKDAIDILFGL